MGVSLSLENSDLGGLKNGLDGGKEIALLEGVAAHTDKFQITTSGKGTYEISQQVAAVIAQARITDGTATVFVRHTSASIVIMENADPTARTDLEEYFERLVPENSDYFIHTYEGPDDMPSHIRMTLTGTSEVIPVMEGRLMLGTWQGLFLFEHRRAPHTREIVVAVVGE